MNFDVELLLQIESDLCPICSAQRDFFRASHPRMAGFVLDIKILLDHRQLKDLSCPLGDNFLLWLPVAKVPVILDCFRKFFCDGQCLSGKIDKYQPRRYLEDDKEEYENTDAVLWINQNDLICHLDKVFSYNVGHGHGWVQHMARSGDEPGGAPCD